MEKRIVELIQKHKKTIFVLYVVTFGIFTFGGAVLFSPFSIASIDSKS